MASTNIQRRDARGGANHLHARGRLPAWSAGVFGRRGGEHGHDNAESTATSWTGDTVRLTDAANLPDTFSGEKTLATFTVPLASTPALELRDADGNTVKTGAWNLRRSSDGTSLLLSYHRGTVFTLR